MEDLFKNADDYFDKRQGLKRQNFKLFEQKLNSLPERSLSKIILPPLTH